METTKLKYAHAETPVPLGLVYTFAAFIAQYAASGDMRTGANCVGECCEKAALEYSWDELVRRYCERVPVEPPLPELPPHEYFLCGTGFREVNPRGVEFDDKPTWDEDGLCSVEHVMRPATITIIAPEVITTTAAPAVAPKGNSNNKRGFAPRKKKKR